MIETIINWIGDLSATIRARHGVNPSVFLALSAVCGPLFYYSLYQMARSMKRDRSKLGRWGLIFLAATVTPYLYVLIFGRNLPWWMYAVLVVTIGLGIRQLVGKLRGGRHSAEAVRP